MRWKLLLASTLLAATMGNPTLASDLRINGFISIQANMMADKEDRTKQATHFANATDKLNFKNGSLLGIQLVKDVNEKVSVTGQLVSRGSQNSFDTEATWAYVAYKVSDSSTLKAGKIRSPFYNYSDFLEVGYAYQWVRPPFDVYSTPDYSTMEGIHFMQEFGIGEDIEANVQIYYGAYDYDVPGFGKIISDGLKGLVFTANWNSFGFRVSAHQSDVTVDTPAIANGTAIVPILNAFGIPQAAQPALMNKFKVNETRTPFYEMAFKYDDGSHFALLEMTRLGSGTLFFTERDSYVISYGYNFDGIKPHISYSVAETIFDSNSLYKNIQKILTDRNGGGGTLTLDSSNIIVLGIRYDFAPSTALKFDVQKRELKTVNGLKEDNTLYSLALDVIF